MSKTAKIIISISAIVLAIVTAVLIWMYYPAIKTAINGERYYTLEDVENAYNDGVNDKEEMESQINFYKIEIDKYIKDIADYQSKIKELNASLQDAINSGNADKETIAGLQEDLAEAQADISAKQAQIAELQDDIKFYQELLEAYEDSGKLVVTFTLVDNGVETTHDVQVVEPNGYLTAVVTPTASDFEGWSLSKGGDLIEDLTTVQVTENMTVYGMFTNTVTFMVNGEEYATQEVSYNKYATDVEVTLTGYNLNGWSLTENGNIVILNETPITVDTQLYANFVESLDTFNLYTWNGLSEFSGQNIWTDGQDYYYSWGANQYILNNATSTWEEKTWTEVLSNGKSNFYPQAGAIWIDPITNTVYHSYYVQGGEEFGLNGHHVLNKETMEWESKTWNGLSEFNGIDIWNDGANCYYSNGPEQYILDRETSTWEENSWNNFTPEYLQSTCIWTDGINYYYSNQSFQYVLNKETSTWEEKTWNINFGGDQVWTDGQNIYICELNFPDGSGGKQYILNKSASAWEEKTWNNAPASLQSGDTIVALCFWTDGTNTYFSCGTDQYILV